MNPQPFSCQCSSYYKPPMYDHWLTSALTQQNMLENLPHAGTVEPWMFTAVNNQFTTIKRTWGSLPEQIKPLLHGDEGNKRGIRSKAHLTGPSDGIAPISLEQAGTETTNLWLIALGTKMRVLEMKSKHMSI